MTTFDLDERLAKLKATVLKAGYCECALEALRFQHFRDMEHTEMMEQLGAWKRRHKIKIDLEPRKVRTELVIFIIFRPE